MRRTPPHRRFLTEVGLRVLVIREARGKSRAWLAAKLARSRSHISRIESGEADLQLTQLCRVARALGVPLARLLPGVGQ